MIDPLSAAALGGFAYDSAKTAITKWISSRISGSIDASLRGRELKQGRPSKDQQTELAAVITAAVELTAGELFPGQERLQERFGRALLQGTPQEWPLVDGSDLTHLVDDVHAWVTKNDPRPETGKEPDRPDSHPYLAVLCRNIIAQFGFRAENSGVRNSILSPRWNRFWTTELLESSPVGTVLAQPTGFGAACAGMQAGEAMVMAGVSPPRAWPRRFGSIPPLAAARQTRPIDAELESALSGGGIAVVRQMLLGMGGVGKTQIAAYYADQCWQERSVDLLIWVNAVTRESIESALAQAAAEIFGADGTKSDQAAQAMLAWLDRPDAPPWLVVFDDLTDPADLNCLWPPTSRRGRTIITTRPRDAALDTFASSRIEVDLFTPEEAVAYLRERLAHKPQSLDDAGALAGDLGYLPLALAQAAAYISDLPGMTCGGYRELLADRTVGLAELSPEVLPDRHGHAVAAAWSLSLELAELPPEPPTGPFTNGLATAILQLSSLLDPAGIPHALFTTAHVREHLRTAVDEGAVRGERTPPGAREITATLARLHRLSLLDFDGTTVRMHGLVQHVLRDTIEALRFETNVLTAADALMSIWLDHESPTATGAVLLSNADYLSRSSGPALVQHAHPLLLRLGDALGSQGQVAGAAAHFRQLGPHCLRTLGREHRFSMEVLHRHAHWLGESGRVATAANLFTALYNSRLKVDGPTHPDTLRARHGRARWTGEKGDLVQAIDELRTLLQLRIEVLGPDDPETLTVRHDLAYWIGHSGNPTGAVAAFQKVLAERTRIMGPDHISTLAAHQNLAFWMGEAGNLEGATAATEQLLAHRIRVLSPDHLDVLATRSTLARWRGRNGEASTAISMNEELLADCRRVLGPDHPFTLTTRHNLAHWRGVAGAPATAATQTASLLSDRTRVLGPDHPDTLRTRQNLAVWKGEAGLPGQAVSELEQVLRDDLRVLGPEHPETLVTRHNLARWQGISGNTDVAIAAFERLLPDFDRVLKPHHRHTVIARNNFSLLLSENPWPGHEGCEDESEEASGGLVSGGGARAIGTTGGGPLSGNLVPQGLFGPAVSALPSSDSGFSGGLFRSLPAKKDDQELDDDPLSLARRETGNIWGYVRPNEDPYN